MRGWWCDRDRGPCGESDALATTCQLTELEAARLPLPGDGDELGGEGYRSAEVAQSTAPTTVVSMVRNASTTDSITIEWEDVASAEGADPVTGYKIYDRVVTPLSEVTEAFESAGIAEATLDHFFDYELNEMVVDTIMYDGSGETQSRTTIANLEGGKLYNFVIDALSDAGISNRSVVTSMSTCTPAPTNVTSVAHTTDDITVSWVAPVVASDAAQVERYVLYRNDGTADGALDIEVDRCRHGHTCVVEGLEGGTEYLFGEHDQRCGRELLQRRRSRRRRHRRRDGRAVRPDDVEHRPGHHPSTRAARRPRATSCTATTGWAAPTSRPWAMTAPARPS